MDVRGWKSSSGRELQTGRLRNWWLTCLLMFFAVAPLAHAQQADLSVGAAVDDPAPLVGATVTFKIRASNAGPSRATVVVLDRLPTGYGYVGHDATAGTYAPTTGSWSLELAPASSEFLRILAYVRPAGDYTDVAQVAVSNRPDPDSTPGNNDPTEDDYASIATVPVVPNVPPVITGQVPISAPGGTPITIGLDNLTVDDPDDVYPDDFTLTLYPGDHYTITEPDEITPETGFQGDLTVPVTVNDGTDDSAAFDMQITVRGPPNFVVLMLDDLDTRSLNDLLRVGLMPNLKAYILDRGVSFTQSYVTTPLCCPSRASFMTGRYPHNTDIVNNKVYYPGHGLHPAAGLFNDHDTIATRMHALGYTTALIGKYLNGYGSDADLAPIGPAFDPTYIPPGWTEWHTLVDFSTYCVYDYTMNHNGTLQTYHRPVGMTEDTKSYQTNVLTDIMSDFLDRHHDDAAPFFLFLTPIAPHAEECGDAYGGVPPRGESSFKVRIRPAPEFKDTPVPAFVPSPSYNEDVSDKPLWAQLPPMTLNDLANIREQYAWRLRSVLSADRMIGKMIDGLGDRLDNTVLIFVSDNGWYYGEHRRGGKILAYDEAARVPLTIVLPESTTASTRPNVVLNNDILPTILNLASPGYGDVAFDGRSFVPLLLTASPPAWIERKQFLTEFGRSIPEGDAQGDINSYSAIRTPNLLYIESYGGVYWQPNAPPLVGVELYDLDSDPYEMSSETHYPENPRHPALGAWIDRLESCAKSSCKLYENGKTHP